MARTLHMATSMWSKQTAEKPNHGAAGCMLCLTDYDMV